jgi:transposase
MFAVEIYAAVRRFVFIEGKSRREAARVFGLSRETIAKMCRYSARPAMCDPRLRSGRSLQAGKANKAIATEWTAARSKVKSEG